MSTATGAAPECGEPFLLLLGAPGSGKSHWSRRYFRTNCHVSLDELRGRVSGDPGNQWATPYAVTAMHAIVEGRARLGLPVVIDATNADAKDREPLLSIAYRWSRAPVAVIFDVPLQVCLDRNARRSASRRVPERYVREVHARLRRDFPVERTWIADQFIGAAWVIHNNGMRVGGGVIMDSARHYGAADWLDEAREPAPDGWRGTGKWMTFRRAGWELRGQLQAAQA